MQSRLSKSGVCIQSGVEWLLCGTDDSCHGRWQMIVIDASTVLEILARTAKVWNWKLFF